MNLEHIPENEYLLLTPGPLSTTKSVRASMLKDWCTWDVSYNELVEWIRDKIVSLAVKDKSLYTSVLMQGSGTFTVEAVIGSTVPRDGKILFLTNGAYGKRMVKIAQYLNIDHTELCFPDTSPIDAGQTAQILKNDPAITHVAFVHLETTTGILNPIEPICSVIKEYQKICIVDAMSSFGGMEIDVEGLGIDYLISSANKCIQGVPGFGFVIARRSMLAKCQGYARSLSLDIYDQWVTMEKGKGKWRFTSPTHVVRAFYQALLELEEEGGIPGRNARFAKSQKTLIEGLKALGIDAVIPEAYQSPVITSFYYPKAAVKSFNFEIFYNLIKENGFVIYPGKLTDMDTFRVGNIGDVDYKDMERLIQVIRENRFWE